jgi:hypothetical protein
MEFKLQLDQDKKSLLANKEHSLGIPDSPKGSLEEALCKAVLNLIL